MSQNPRTIAQLKRKVERLEAMLKACQDFMQRDRIDEFNRVRLCVDQKMRIDQAMAILRGEDE